MRAGACGQRNGVFQGRSAHEQRLQLHVDVLAHKLRVERRQQRAADGPDGPSEKETKLAQKLGQLQPFIAVLPRQSMGQLASFEPT